MCETIPDGLLSSDANATQDIPTLSSSILRNCLEPFKKLVLKLLKDSNAPPVTWIVSDSSMIFTWDASKELGIPMVFLWTASASAFLGYTQYRHLIDEGITKSLTGAHAICIPCPAQGHIAPMLKLAKLLHFYGFHITFVNTKYNHRRLLKSRGPASLDSLSSFRFETIPDGLPSSGANATQDIPTLSSSILKNCLEPFKKLLLKLLKDSNAPPVTWIVSDSSMIFTWDASKELGIPMVLLWTASASAFLGYTQYRHLIDEGIVPLKGTIRSLS
ncbi:hypothetical protein Ancab_007856 [Ancistrocladus abbreviatus]